MTRATLLAVDCSGDPCSVAISHAGRCFRRRSAPGSRQSEQVLRWVDELIAESDLSAAEIDGLAVAIGPGGFTGVRLAVATVQGLALAWQVPIVPVSSLAALAMRAPPGDLPLLAALDARMGEVYAAWFHRGEGDELRPLSNEQVLAPGQLLRPHGVDKYRIIGSAQAAHADAIIDALGVPEQVLAEDSPDAREVLTLALQSWPEGAQAAEQLQPTYLRDKVALTSVEQAAARHGRGA